MMIKGKTLMIKIGILNQNDEQKIKIKEKIQYSIKNK